MKRKYYWKENITRSSWRFGKQNKIKTKQNENILWKAKKINAKVTKIG